MKKRQKQGLKGPSSKLRSATEGAETDRSAEDKSFARWWKNAPKVNLKLPPRKRERMRDIGL